MLINLDSDYYALVYKNRVYLGSLVQVLSYLEVVMEMPPEDIFRFVEEAGIRLAVRHIALVLR